MDSRRLVRVDETCLEKINTLRALAKSATGADVSFAAMTRAVLDEGVKVLLAKHKKRKNT